MADGIVRICFTVHHRVGTDNANADALSRLCPLSSAISASPTPLQNDVVCFAQLTSTCNLQKEQKKDTALQIIRQVKSNRMPKPPLFARKSDPHLQAYWNCWDELHLIDGLLVRNVSVLKGPPK